jgi:hypothetical protein
MRQPDEVWMAQLVERELPEGRALPRFALCQPAWFKPELLSNRLRTVAEALAEETATDPERATWIVTTGPEGVPRSDRPPMRSTLEEGDGRWAAQLHRSRLRRWRQV